MKGRLALYPRRTRHAPRRFYIMDTPTTSLSKSNDQAFDNPVLQAMAEAGVFYGRKKSVTHPRMRQYIFTSRNNIEILDLEKVKDRLDAAVDFLRTATEHGGFAMVVGALPASKKAVERMAQRFQLPYVTNRWLGGTLTNFKVISQRIEHMKKMRQEIATGGFDKYKKRERGQLLKEFERLEKLMGGLEQLTKMPAVLIVINIDAHATAVREARRLNIPVIGVAGTLSDPESIAYPVPANDTAKASIEYIMGIFEEAVEQGLRRRGAEGVAEKKMLEPHADVSADDLVKETGADVSGGDHI